MTTWSPEQYLRYADLRTRPALDLLARVPLASARRVCDLGCGTGAVTRILAERFPSARVVGVDRSAEMLRAATQAPSRVAWVEADVAGWAPDEPPDLVWANAALHWLPDHAALFPRLLGWLAPGGCLAVQMPLSHDLPSHRLMRATLADGDGGRPFGSEELRAAAARRPVAAPDVYHELLAPRARTLDVWTTEYLQVLDGDDPVLEWVRGTGLRPVLEGLADGQRARFEAAYRERLRAAYPRRADGTTLFPFRRLFVVATT